MRLSQNGHGMETLLTKHPPCKYLGKQPRSYRKVLCPKKKFFCTYCTYCNFYTIMDISIYFCRSIPCWLVVNKYISQNNLQNVSQNIFKCAINFKKHFKMLCQAEFKLAVCYQLMCSVHQFLFFCVSKYISVIKLYIFLLNVHILCY